MPGIKRWFPVSQHINRDSELWELCKLYGDRALRVWLEVLSIADRNEGTIPGASAELPPDLRRTLADASRTTGQTVANCWRRFQELSWVTPSSPVRITNWRDYHRKRKATSVTTDVAIGPPPSEPSEPILPKSPKSPLKGNGQEKIIQVLDHHGKPMHKPPAWNDYVRFDQRPK